MISEKEVDEALEWLVVNAPRAAQARAERIYMEEYRKTLKAIIMGDFNNRPVAVQEREAYADERYIVHLRAMRDAIKADEEMRWMYVARQALIEAWRTMQANERIQAKIG